MRILFILCLILSSGLEASAAFGQSCTLMDNFDSGVTPFWVFSDPSIVTVSGGVLDIDFTGQPSERHWAELTDCIYTDFEAMFRVRDLDSTYGKGFGFRTTGPDHLGYGVNLLSSPTNKVLLTKGTFAYRDILAESTVVHDTGQWLDVRVTVVGAVFTVEVDGAVVLSYTDPNPIPSGAIFLNINAGGTLSAHTQWDDFVIDAYVAVETAQESWGTVKGRY